MFIVRCDPVLSINNRDTLVLTDSSCYRTIHKLNLQILEYSKSFYEFLGYDIDDFQEKNTLYSFLSTDSIDIIVKRHRDRKFIFTSFILIYKIHVYYQN